MEHLQAKIHPPFSPLLPIHLAHNSSFLPITRLPTFFPPKTPQGTLDEAIVGRKNRTCTFFRSSPFDARPSTHRIASFTVFFFLPTPKLPFLICVPPRFTLHLEPFLAPFYATIPIPLLFLTLLFFTPSTRTFSSTNIGENGS